MTTGLQHVMPGQPFQPTADAWNAFVDAARYAHNQRVVFGVPPLNVATEEFFYLKLDAELTAAQLEDGETGTGTLWIDNPDWGPGEDPFIETDPPQSVTDVVPWDKVTALAADTLYLAKRIGAFNRVMFGECA